MIEEALLARLMTSPYHVRLILIAKALARAGYGEPVVMDRWRPSQRTRHGGFELLIDRVSVSGRRRTAVKVLEEAVRLRNVDEMAGTILRTGVSSGLVVSPAGITGKVAFYAGRGRYRPLDLKVVAGDQLGRLLSRTGVGVRGGKVDEALFSDLEQMERKEAR